MEVRFSKYHGLGNDFIIIKNNDNINYEEFAKQVCNRYTGIGADGLIVVFENPLRMLFYNQDGSKGSMCGNGLRCFSKYAFDNDLVNENSFFVTTDSYKYLVEVEGEIVKTKFPYSFDTKLMEIDTNEKEFLNKMVLDSTCYAVFTGTSHLVVFVDDVNKIEEEYARNLHQAKEFKKKINVNFVKVLNKNKLQIKTFERGVGFTLACGTGTVAAFVIARLLNYVDKQVTVDYSVGSMLLIEEDKEIYVEAIAVRIADGIFYWN